ncbi:MAG TPA: hypothetical protein VID27_01365 [Blastocatellia bacterium]|jgi:hypothetical protein
MHRSDAFKNSRPPSSKFRSIIEIEIVMAALLTMIALLYGLYVDTFFLLPNIWNHVENSWAFKLFEAWLIEPMAELMYPALMNPCTTRAAFNLTAQGITILAGGLSMLWWAVAIDGDR